MTQTVNKLDYLMRVNQRNINLMKNQTISISDTEYKELWPPQTNGHDYVDLGLPSGTLWATMNVGAANENKSGSWYAYGKGSTKYWYGNMPSSTYTGTENPLDLYVDTARQAWGGDWHMPTKEQFQELLDNTTHYKTQIGNYPDYINVERFTAPNGNFIYLPYGGFVHSTAGELEYNETGTYLTSSSDNDSSCYLFSFRSSNAQIYSSNDGRSSVFSVRAVLG